MSDGHPTPEQVIEAAGQGFELHAFTPGFPPLECSECGRTIGDDEAAYLCAMAPPPTETEHNRGWHCTACHFGHYDDLVTASGHLQDLGVY